MECLKVTKVGDRIMIASLSYIRTMQNIQTILDFICHRAFSNHMNTSIITMQIRKPMWAYPMLYSVYFKGQTR